MNTREKGSIGEVHGEEYLLCRGYSILVKNYYCPYGELDRIAYDNIHKKLVFIEIKASFKNSNLDPLFWVTSKKQKRILMSAQYFLQEHQLNDVSCRIDVIAIWRDKITHITNAISV